MSKKNPSPDEILKILEEYIPSDYEEHTDIESEDDYEPPESIDVLDRVMEEESSNVEETVTLNVDAQEESNFNLERSTTKRKWRKKEEKESDTDFMSDDGVCVQNLATPFDSFRLLLAMK